MRCSDSTLEYTAEYLKKRNPLRVELMEKLTVKLQGNVRNAVFTGTGVILSIAKPDLVYVVTAKHNLHVAAPGRSGDDLVDDFKSKIGVYFSTVGAKSIHAIKLLDGDARNRGYDVMVLTVKDAGLYGAVNTFLAPSRANAARHYTSMDFQAGRDKRIVGVLAKDEARRTLGALKRGEVVDFGKERCVLVQLGWGRAHTDQQEYGRRALRVVRLRNPTFIDATADHMADVFTFDTGNADTTREGDSGGPIFAVDEREHHVWLVGITLGANFYLDKEDPPTNTFIYNNAFTVVSTERLGEHV